MRRDIALSAVVALLVAAAGLAAQQATFRAKVDLVLIDAVVVDKDGNAVHGLTVSDFVLTDRGRPQSIATFEELSHVRPADAVAVPALPPTFKLDVASNTTAATDRLVMVFIDDLHIWQGRTDTAKALAREVVSRLGSEASMAVVFSSRDGSTEITQDRSTLLAAIENMTARQTFRRPHQGFPDQKAAYVPPEAPVELKIAAVNAANRASLQDLYDNWQHIRTMEDAARLLINEDRRRKSFVLISEGMAADFSALQGTAASIDIVSRDAPVTTGGAVSVLALLEALRRANITLYAIDPRGQVRAEDMMLESWPPPDCAVCENPPALPQPSERIPSREDSQFRWNNPVRMAQDGLGFLTEAAGGFAVTDTNDLSGGVTRILQDLDHYYMLGFYPAASSATDGRHAVEVRVPGHPDYTVRFRRGYTREGASRPPGYKPSLAGLSAGVMPIGDLPLRLTALPLPGRGKAANVAVTLEVTTPVSDLKEADNKLRGDVSYSVMVVDGRRARVTQRTGRSARFTMRAEEASPGEPDSGEPAHVTYQIPLLIDLEPGRYQLRASVISKKLGTGGSVYLDIVVPDFQKAPLSLSAIALGFADGARVPVGRTNARALAIPGIELPPLPPAQVRAQNGENPLPFEPTLRRDFEAADAIRAYFEVVRRDARPTNVAVRILDAGQETRLGMDLIIGPADHGRVDLGIPLKSLAPGAYILRATATDSRSTATTETGFIVKPY